MTAVEGVSVTGGETSLSMLAVTRHRCPLHNSKLIPTGECPTCSTETASVRWGRVGKYVGVVCVCVSRYEGGAWQQQAIPEQSLSMMTSAQQETTLIDMREALLGALVELPAEGDPE